jgi:hypothetical protein
MLILLFQQILSAAAKDMAVAMVVEEGEGEVMAVGKEKE